MICLDLSLLQSNALQFIFYADIVSSIFFITIFFLPFFIHFRCCLYFEKFFSLSSVKMPDQQPWRAVPKAAEKLRLYTAMTT